jgi:hypothetical protein
VVVHVLWEVGEEEGEAEVEEDARADAVKDALHEEVRQPRSVNRTAADRCDAYRKADRRGDCEGGGQAELESWVGKGGIDEARA